ncbi:MAG: SurA N-terminal domain-containing protein [Desulfovibrionales bacterium]|nr:SurA N-terminal domain-containing protein [Desulfovibrionales bacterium]
MLDFMRRHTRAWLIKIILVAVILVFIFWGVGTIRARRADMVAEVNGLIITRADYQRAYNNALKNYQQIYGDALPGDLLKKMNLDKVVLDGIIKDVLAQEGAAGLGIRVSDEEINEYIHSMPVFNEGGRFSEERYRGILENARLTPAAFEEDLRKELLWAKVADTLGRLAKVSDDEVWNAFQYANRRINLAYIPFTAAAFKNQVKVEEPALRQYFTGHQEDYRVPARVRVRLARFLFKDYAPKVNVSPAAVENYYKSNTEAFREPERRRVSHIFFSLKPEATGEEVTGAQARAEEALRKAGSGEDFVALARQVSEDKSALRGGDLGYLRQGTTDSSLEKVVFSLEKGGISPVVRSKAGLHIIKVTEVVTSAVKPLAAVAADIKKFLTENKVREFAMAGAARTYEQIIRAGGLDRYARAQNLPLTETGFFSEQDEVDGVGREAGFNRAALALKKGEVSSLIKLPQGYFVCEVIERKESFIPKFEEIEVKVKADFTENQAAKLAESEANKFISGLKGGQQFSDLIRKYGFSARETGYIASTALSGNEFPFARSAQELSILTPAHPYIQQPVRAGDAFYVVSLAGTKEAPKELYETQKDAIKEKLLLMQRDVILKGWLDGLKKKAEIGYGEEFEKYR